MNNHALSYPYIEEPLPPKETMPTMYDLPDEEVGQSGMPDIFHVWQARLLDETFRPPNYEPQEVFTASDLNLYYNTLDVKQYKRPDWFAVVGLPKDTEQPQMRLSYVTWQEGIDPLIVIELLSPSTEKDDLGQRLRDVTKPPTKWDVYERWLRVPYYVVFSRYTNELRVFTLNGSRYREVEGHQGRFWIEDVKLGLGVWQGRYLGEDFVWLRWYDQDGNWIQNLEERAAHEAQRAEYEAQRAEAERQEKEAAQQKAQQLAAKLRALGVDPDQL
jgi:Uma2 family endonuclease